MKLIPQSVRTLKIRDFDCYPDSLDGIPSTITYLKFYIKDHYKFLQSLKPGYIPSTISKLRIDMLYCLPGSIPSSVVKIKGALPEISGVIPLSVKNMVIPFYCDINWELVPSSVEKLKIKTFEWKNYFSGYGYEREIQNYHLNFPPSITNLIIFYDGYMLNRTELQKLPLNLFDDTLSSLNIIGCPYDDKLKISPNLLQPNISELTIEFRLISDLKVPLPSSITKLSIGSMDRLIPDIIPPSVTELSLSYLKCDLIPGFIPSSVKTLRFCRHSTINNLSSNIIPQFVKTLIIKTNIKKRIEPNSIPESVTNLKIYESYNYKDCISYFPQTITTLTIDSSFPDMKLIPQSVRTLKIRDIDCYPDSLDGIPSTITYLKFYIRDNCDFHQSLKPGYIPSTISKLRIDMLYCLPGSIPSSVVKIKGALPKISGVIPLSVKNMVIPFYYDINWELVPSS
eukprot:gene6028-7512_t